MGNPDSGYSGYLVVSTDYSKSLRLGRRYRGMDSFARGPDTFSKMANMWDDNAYAELRSLVAPAWSKDPGFFQCLHCALEAAERVGQQHEEVEVIFCRTCEGPENGARPEPSHPLLDYEFLGFDVSDHDDFSAINNGLFGHLHRELNEHFAALNEDGLFPSYEAAVKFREAYLAQPVRETFEADDDLRIWEVYLVRPQGGSASR